jgi:signal transduction histidine kinase
MSGATGVAVVEDFLETMVAASREVAALEHLSQDTRVTINGTAFSWSDYLERLQTSDQRFDIVDVDLCETVDAGDMVAARHNLYFEHSGTAYGVEPNQNCFVEPSASFYETEDGLITRLDIVHDPTATLEALDLLSEDPTTEKLRDQYYEVLNRVLRHNLRNKLNTIQANAELAHENPAAAAATIQQQASDLLSTVDKARKIQQTAIDPPIERGQFTVRAAVEPVLDSYTDREDVVCHYECQPEPLWLRSDKHLLRNIVAEAVENAVVYSDTERTEVCIEAEAADTDQHAVTLRITDNGSGIPHSELEPLRKDHETALLHGSGIGLWIIKWGVTRLDGTVEFRQTDPSEVRITLPNLHR